MLSRRREKKIRQHKDKNKTNERLKELHAYIQRDYVDDEVKVSL